MASTINEPLVVSTPVTVDKAETREGMPIARYCVLEELPGLVFGVTRRWAYIVLSLVRLAP